MAKYEAYLFGNIAVRVFNIDTKESYYVDKKNPCNGTHYSKQSFAHYYSLWSDEPCIFNQDSDKLIKEIAQQLQTLIF